MPTQEEEFYRKNSIIQPPENDESIVKRTFKYIVDSRERNYSLYPNPNKYKIKLTEDVTDVISIELVAADIPFSRYLIHKANNQLVFNEHPSNNPTYDKTAIIEPGDYTMETLAAATQNAINAVSDASGGITVTVNTTKSTLVYTTPMISSTGDPLRWTVKTNGQDVLEGDTGNTTSTYKPFTAAKILGFANAEYNTIVQGTASQPNGSSTQVLGTGTKFTTLKPTNKILLVDPTTENTLGPYEVQSIQSDTELTLTQAIPTTYTNQEIYLDTLVSPFRVNLRPDSYMIMRLKRVKNNYANGTHTNQSYAIIPREQQTLNMWSPEFRTIKMFNPIMTDLRNLEISFVDYEGNPYDFQNQDHRLELIIRTFKQSRRYNDIFKGIHPPYGGN